MWLNLTDASERVDGVGDVIELELEGWSRCLRGLFQVPVRECGGWVYVGFGWDELETDSMGWAENGL